MKFKFDIIMADEDYPKEVEINSLDDLQALQERYKDYKPIIMEYIVGWPNSPLIVDFFRMEITLYNGYIE